MTDKIDEDRILTDAAEWISIGFSTISDSKDADIIDMVGWTDSSVGYEGSGIAHTPPDGGCIERKAWLILSMSFFFSSRRRHTRLRTVTGVQT